MSDSDEKTVEPIKTDEVEGVQDGSTAKMSNSPKVLIVEDDPLIVKMYQAKFTHEGFQVMVAEDGLTGLNMALKNDPSFIVLDIMMPQLSGIDLLEKLRTDTKGKTIPVIILTNLSEKDEEQKAIQLGAKEYLLKANLTPGEVVLKVKKHLGIA
ncbi:response regulator [Candidatus Woesebacteria bacterium]|nr:MAG: response regulator [Candidatus Woesebacteria bacterium]